MTVSRRKNKPVAKPEDSRAAESGVQYHCDICGLDISSTVRISCATCASAPAALDTYDLCCCCFLEGAESGTHKAWHDYRVVEQHAYPIFCDDWGADEELLLIDGAQMYGLGNWADIADHIGNRSKEEVQQHYISVYIEGRDGTQAGEERAAQAVNSFRTANDGDLTGKQLPVVGPNPHFIATVDTEEFQKRKRQRIEDARSAFGSGSNASGSQAQQAQGNSAKVVVPPKPLVSAPTSHSELATFMPGRLEFEVEHENDAENYIKDMEFGKVYRFGGEMMPSEMEALGRKAEQGRVRMEGSGRGGPGLGSRGGNKGMKEDDDGVGGNEAAKDNHEKEEGAEEDGDETNKHDDEHADEDDDDDHDDHDDEDEAHDDADADQTQMDITVEGGAHDADASTATAADGNVNATTDATGTTSTVAGSASQAADTDDRAPDWDEEDADLELKLMVLEIYNERLDRRARRKEFIFERNLVDYKRTIAAERKRPKEEREVLNRVRHFAQMQTTLDFEAFYNGLCYEDALRRAAAQLQMYRRAGITNLTDAHRFETEQAERARRAAVAAEGGLAAFPAAGSVPRSAAARAAARDTSTPDDSDGGGAAAHALGHGGGKKKSSTAAGGAAAISSSGPDGEKKPARKPPRPLDLSSHPSLSLLTRAEQEMCSVVRIQPQVFMLMKKDIIVEYVRRKGKFSRRESRQLFKCDVNKVGKVYDLLESEGYLREAARLGGGWDGVGTPPGWAASDKGKSTNGVAGKPNGASAGASSGTKFGGPLNSNGTNVLSSAAGANSPRPTGNASDNETATTNGRGHAALHVNSSGAATTLPARPV